MPEKIVKFLLKYGADPHIEDRNGNDACDKGHELYPNIPTLTSLKCRQTKGLRTTYQEARIKNKI